MNAGIWLGEIAEVLAELDPGNSATYAANAKAGAALLDGLTAELQGMLDGAPGFIVSHDAFGYFENRFGVAALGAIAESDARAPGPARVAALRDAATAAEVHCVLVEPQFNEGLAGAVVGDGMNLGVIDALGTDLEQGATLYPGVIRGIADAILSCADG